MPLRPHPAIPLALVFLTLPAGAADVDALYRALETGDTRAATLYVEDHYREAGISLNDTLTWEFQSFDKIVNWYNEWTELIMLSAMPQPAEVAPYWQNWSAALSGGRWDWQAFFADEAEAALMANFNQFVLAAHEYGHALTYRYDPYHVDRMDREINCREYFADRLAAALLEEAGEADPRLEGLRSRYRALMADINAAIAPADRYAAPDFAALDADCRVMHVVQPTEDTMTPYASAFFVRQSLLMAEDLPPLAELYAQHLFAWHDAARPPASTYAGAVTTAADVVAADWRATPSGLKYDNRHMEFATDGTLYAIDFGEDDDANPPRYRFAYGPVEGEIEEVVPVRALEGVAWGEYDLFNPAGAVPLGPDRFVAFTASVGFGGFRNLLFDVRRDGAGPWRVRVSELDPLQRDFTDTRLVRRPDGALFAFGREMGEAPDWTGRWIRMALDGETLAVIAEDVVPDLAGSRLMGMGAKGELYFYLDDRIVVLEADGVVRAYAGAGLQGFKDNGSALLAEFAAIGSNLHMEPDGGVRLLDFDPASRRVVVRHIAPGETRPTGYPGPVAAIPASRADRRAW